MKSQRLVPLNANAGVEAAYRRALKALLKALHDDVLDELAPHFTQVTLAQDSALSQLLAQTVKRLGLKWRDKLDKLGPKVAAMFAKQSSSHTDKAFMRALKQAGFTVRFQFTPRQQEAYEAVLAANVGLISNLAAQHLHGIEQAVLHSVSTGHDMHTLSQTLQQQYGMSRRRADFIARDQNHKAKATIEQARRLDLGITQATWQHSTAGRHPRPSHVAANGKTYDIAKGMYLDGEWVLPGQAINCRCTSRAILPFERMAMDTGFSPTAT